MAMATSDSTRLARVAAPDEIRTGGGVAAAAKNLAFTIIPILLIMVGWEIAVRTSQVPEAVLPPLSNIGLAIWGAAISGQLWLDISSTLGRLFQSALIGIAAGTVIGVMMGYFKIWERMLIAPMNFMLAVPGTAMFPLSMIWFGLNDLAIISILIYEVALTVMLNTWTGVKTVDLSLIRAGRAFGVSKFGMFWRVLIPGALPSIIAGYRLGFSRCWRILIVAEMLVSVSSGMGYRIFWAREYFNSDLLYGSLFMVGVVGLLIERVLLRTLEMVTVDRWGVMREL